MSKYIQSAWCIINTIYVLAHVLLRAIILTSQFTKYFSQTLFHFIHINNLMVRLSFKKINNEKMAFSFI